MLYCILATTFFLGAEPAKVEQLSPCYRSFAICEAALPFVAHRLPVVADVRMMFRCAKEEKAA